MNPLIRSKIISFCFAAILGGFLLTNLVLPDNDFSYSERRKLMQAPSLTLEKLAKGTLFQEFDKYVLDQFVLRDTFRSIKAIGSYYVLQQMDNNEIYIVDNHISKMVFPMNEKAILSAAKKINEVKNLYLVGKKISYSVIPDKNYFLAEQNGYLSLDYTGMMEILQENITDVKYIDLFDFLSIEDYYYTDIHWRQEELLDAAEKLMLGMGRDLSISIDQYEAKEFYPFRGSLLGQSALPVEPDTMKYLTNSVIEDSIVYDYEIKDNSKVYLPEKFEGVDPYDVFLSGAKSLLKITNENADNDRELILFRDSFGSSIAPLFLLEYSSIILVDLRYMATSILDDYIDFSKEQDVLFLYNTQLLNSGYLLK
ncbi:MAG TPA: hypothetical protein DIW17_17865 [Clostridiales bacterium]|nr:DHHW family protein [Clostridia bacterium]HCS75726.1 hypothetical protein [Clostridiales bacterium]